MGKKVSHSKSVVLILVLNKNNFNKSSSNREWWIPHVFQLIKSGCKTINIKSITAIVWNKITPFGKIPFPKSFTLLTTSKKR